MAFQRNPLFLRLPKKVCESKAITVRIHSFVMWSPQFCLSRRATKIYKICFSLLFRVRIDKKMRRTRDQRSLFPCYSYFAGDDHSWLLDMHKFSEIFPLLSSEAGSENVFPIYLGKFRPNLNHHIVYSIQHYLCSYILCPLSDDGMMSVDEVWLVDYSWDTGSQSRRRVKLMHRVKMCISNLDSFDVGRKSLITIWTL